MSRRKGSKALDAAKRSELEIAAAVAREGILQLHMTAALRLIEIASDRVSAVRILGIYLRLHGFNGAEASILANRVLAHIGQRAARGAVIGSPVIVEGDEPEIQQDAVSLLRAVRERLRGRIHHELRRWVELHTGATQLALLDTHVRHAERFVRELAETHSVSAATQVYIEMVGVGPALREVLYLGVLDKLADEELPKRKSKTPEVTVLPKTSISKKVIGG
jgi:hypothetical protein